MKFSVHARYMNPWIFFDVVFGRASLRQAMRNGVIDAAAEIGTQAGINAASILRRAEPVRMVCADPWSGYSDELGMPNSNVERIARRRLKRFPSVEIVKSGDRATIAKSLGECSIDYLYIDAMHDYESVSADMNAYWPCVRCGGMMAGHDIVWASVFGAVADFRAKHGVDVQCSGTDWWIIKTQGN
ncbi:MAG: class I SAM-dependent methyltransferase [Verrucomicrobia bacterium]|nr:class I SAM-dependent methyltransferase [Verrucomicrobiota bacterium]